jgi:hypothetical protein
MVTFFMTRQFTRNSCHTKLVSTKSYLTLSAPDRFGLALDQEILIRAACAEKTLAPPRNIGAWAGDGTPAARGQPLAKRQPALNQTTVPEPRTQEPRA